MSKVNSMTNTMTGRKFTVSIPKSGGVRMAWVEKSCVNSVVVTNEHFMALCAHPAMKIEE